MIKWGGISLEKEQFPLYTKVNDVYGYVVLTWDNRFLFFRIEHTALSFEDITNQFEII